MKAVIMAGGAGTRLRPLTSNTPKPMLPVANRPMMEHILRLLKKHGFEDIVVTLAVNPQVITNYFGDGSEFGVSIAYATEETPMGTAGSVLNARDELDERFLVISGDVLTSTDLSKVVAFHDEKEALVTIGLKAMDNPLEFGIVITRDDGSIERFLEKPSWGEVFSDAVNTGVYVLEPEIFDFIGEGEVDFSGDVFPALLEAEKPMFGFEMEGYWQDVGTLDAYTGAHRDVLEGTVEVEIPGFRMEDGVWMGEGAEVHPDAKVTGPAVIGDYCQVEAGAELSEYTVLGTNVRVGPDATIERSVIHDNVYLASAVNLRGTVVCRASDLRQGARCEEGVVIGDQCLIGSHALINQGVKIYPFKTVEPGATINSSIVWESQGARNLFGRLGVSGLANVDISPELVVRLAMAYATNLEKGATVTTSRDTSRAARALKRAAMVGLTAAGVNVDDLEVATVPVTRFQVRSGNSQGGITVRLDPTDAQSVLIRFLDDEGVDISDSAQSKIERLYYREDFRRAMAADMGDIGFPARTLEHYTEALMATVEADAIRSVGYRLVLDYGFGTASFVMPNVLAKLGADVLSVNPYASTAGATEFDRAEHAAKVGELVLASGANLGAVIDPDGEQITLVDDAGKVVSDDDALFAFVSLVGDTQDKPKIGFPVSAPRALEELCETKGAEVVWTKLSAPHLMEVASSGELALAASQEGGFIFPAFLPAYDATAALVNLLGMLAETEQSLSGLVGQAPDVHVAQKDVETPWEQKGMLMRTMVEQLKDRELVLVDGVKVLHDDGWALVLPDPDEQVTHVWAEGSSQDEAQKLVDEYAQRIEQILD